MRRLSRDSDEDFSRGSMKSWSRQGHVWKLLRVESAAEARDRVLPVAGVGSAGSEDRSCEMLLMGFPGQPAQRAVGYPSGPCSLSITLMLML